MNRLIDRIDFKRIFFRDTIYTRNSLLEAIKNMSVHISGHYHSDSPFILLTAHNHIKTVIAYYAILQLGKIAVILDPEARNFDITEIIDDTEPGALILINTSTIEFNYEEEIVFRNTPANFILSSDLADVCTIAYTNAEDGYVKGAMLTSRNLLCEVEAIVQSINITKNSITCSLLPFHHMFGLVQGILITTLTGGQSVITEVSLLQLEEIAKRISKFNVTHFFSIPSIYFILSKIEGIDTYLKNLQYVVSGGNKLSPFIYERFLKKTKKYIREGYGLTETSPACVFHYEAEIPDVNTIGTPMPGTKVKIVDKHGNECPANTEGEILVYGDLVFKGYLNKIDETNRKLVNNWLHTGDKGKIDEQGNIYFTGLIKKMINVSGNNVYPERLKRFMEMHSNVIETKIESVESCLHGHTVEAFIRLKDNSIAKQKEYKQWCKENITNITLPKSWYFE